MAWTQLPTDYTDATWSGSKKYNLINNDDGTVSLQDVTVYTNKEKSFFGSKDANQMNEGINVIMAALENSTDLYTDFQNYFTTQKKLFENEGDTVISDLQTEANSDYVSWQSFLTALKATTESDLSTIESNYSLRMDTFQDIQRGEFTSWFSGIKGQLSTDAAGNLQNEIDTLNDKVDGFITRTTTFSADGQTITEVWGDYKRITVFSADGKTITETLYNGDTLTKTKITTFENDGTIKEVLQ